MPNLINTTPFNDIFSAVKFGNREVHVIGVGASGSKICRELGKLGLSSFHIYDDDIVKKHNIGPQAFDDRHIGMKKVDAMKEILEGVGKTKVIAHDKKVDGSEALRGVVFVLTDTKSSRRQIWQKGLCRKLRTNLVIETRMGEDQGRVYVIDPNNTAQVNGYAPTLEGDGKPRRVSACGTGFSIGATSGFLANLAVWQLIRWHAIKDLGHKDQLDHEIMFCLRPLLIKTRRYE